MKFTVCMNNSCSLTVLKAQLHGSGSSSNLNYIMKACRKPLCAQCVCALYAYTLKLIVEVTFQITHTQKHSRVRAGDHCIPMTFTQPIRFEY